jgi:hypothetical protein
MADKKVYLVIAFTTLSFFCLAGANSVRAYDINLNLDLNKITSGLPAPINDLINTGKQIWQNFTNGIVSTMPTPILGGGSGGTVDFRETLKNVNTWFVNTTGLNFIQIIKAIGGFVVWVLSTAVELIKQGLSLIK